jgi:hypothetical protein
MRMRLSVGNETHVQVAVTDAANPAFELDNIRRAFKPRATSGRLLLDYLLNCISD